MIFVLVLLFTTCAEALQVIESRIDGDFEGFDEDNIYKLENGQIWIQTEYKYHYHYSYMPEVTIFDRGGRYYMKVEGVSGVVEVEQLR